ncbi:unnamed protein product [Rhizophagus irregularis]|nr:unnamed protein product [Rhizophagus irregularis]
MARHPSTSVNWGIIVPVSLSSPRGNHTTEYLFFLRKTAPNMKTSPIGPHWADQKLGIHHLLILNPLHDTSTQLLFNDLINSTTHSRPLQPAISPLPYSTVVKPQVVYFVVTTQTGSSRLVFRITPYGGYQPPGITNQDPKSRVSSFYDHWMMRYLAKRQKSAF